MPFTKFTNLDFDQIRTQIKDYLRANSNFTDFGNGTGKFSWTPEKGHLGEYYVKFIASDGILEDFCIVEITVQEEINLPPEAQDDYIEVEEDSFDNVIDVLANDSDPNDDPLVIESVTDPIHGIIFNHGHRITYTPDSEYCGDDEFSYTINDGQGETDTAMVYVTVICINEAPITPGKPSGPTNGKVGSQIPYTAVTTDPDGDQISYLFDWGDDTTSGWTEFFPSETNVSKSHKWRQGTFNIRVKAKDEHGLQSEWSEHLRITIPRSRQSQPSFNFNSIQFFNCYSKAITFWIFFQLVLRSFCRELN